MKLIFYTTFIEKFKTRRSEIFVIAFVLVSGFLSTASAKLGGHEYKHVAGDNFSFDPPYESFAGITFNPITRSYYATDNDLDAVFELTYDESRKRFNLLRTISISQLKRSDIATADAEGIAWMYGETYALALHDGKEIAVITISGNSDPLLRDRATIYSVTSKPKGLAYAGWEDAFYWVAKDQPKTVVKAKINRTTGLWETVWKKEVDNLDVVDLADVTLFPKLSPHVFLISESSKKILEVDLSGPTAVLKDSMSLSDWNIPQAGGFAFKYDGTMSVVGKHVQGKAEDDYSVFTVSPPLINKLPTAAISFAP